MGHHTWCALERLEVVHPMDKSVPCSSFSTPYGELLPPLLNIDGEEDAQRITIIIPHLIDSLPPTLARH